MVASLKWNMYKALLCLCSYAAVVANEELDKIAVKTSVGTFVGHAYITENNGRPISTRRFLGIPYAQPPVGDLRFKKPARMGKLDEPFDATDYGPACIQQEAALSGQRKPDVLERLRMSEDCLYLNIYTPNRDIANEKLPVMFYIHGGGFVMGAPQVYAGDVVASFGDVIWVTVAYRLSIWGFLSTGDENLPGNYGLWDQHMAIEWVHEHIDNFGGNADAITLIGTSAGGASTIYQGMFPGNIGLVKRAIPQSGVITNPWAFNPDPLTATKRLATLVGCDNQVSTSDIAVCITSKKTSDLYDTLNNKDYGFVRFPMEFLPTVDHDFLPMSPTELFKDESATAQQYRNALSKLDLMAGLVSGEGLMMVTSFVAVEDPHSFEVDRDRFERELVPEILRVVYGENVPGVLRDIVINEYTNWNDPDHSFKSRESYIDISSDYVFNIQTMATVKLHKTISERNTYVYLYDAFPAKRLLESPFWTGSTRAQHVDDMTTLLGYDNKDGYLQWLSPYSEDQPEEWEAELSKAHITMWTNFAKSGNPNEPRDVRQFIYTVWPKYDMTSQRYLNISLQMSKNSVQQRLFARALNFWYHVLPGVIEALKAGTSEEENGFCEKDGGCAP